MKRFVKRCARRAMVALLLVCSGAAAVAPRSFGEPPPPQQPAAAAANDDVVLQAMNDELQRSIGGLQLKDLDKPYFIEYIVADVDNYTAGATFGALMLSDRNRRRTAKVNVRVGSYDFDNTEFITQSDLFTPSGSASVVTLEDDYNNLRHDLWLLTDNAFKQAAEKLARKRAFVQNTVEEEKVPDFAKEDATITLLAKRQTITLLDQTEQSRWEKQLREWSNLFRQFPEIQESSITFRAQQTHSYLVNNEGTKVRHPQTLIALEVRASAQAADGMRLRHFVPFYARKLTDLPPAEEVTSAIRRMADELTALRRAPVLDANYSGPVLFTGQAAAEMFAQILAPQFSGQRPPLAEQPQFAEIRGSRRSELADKLNRRVLPTAFSVYDDPTKERTSAHGLIGYYQVDDQGVKPQRVELIEAGVLKDLLMSRRPRKERLRSNGHGRNGFFGDAAADIGNLFIEAADGKTDADLKTELLKMCKAQNLPHGIIVRALSTGGADGGGGGVASGGARRDALSAPLLAYKVNVADGREELVRGATSGALTVTALRQITGAGNTGFVYNRMTSAPTSIIAPSVLIEEMDFTRPRGAQQKPGLLAHPYFNK